MKRIAVITSASLALASCGTEAEQTPAGTDPVVGAQGIGTDSQLPPTPNNKPGKSAPAAVGCGPKETTIFACAVRSGKTLAVCSSGGNSATYRFGGDRPEIELEGGRWARAGYSGGGELQIAFENSNTSYVVFSRMVRTNFTAGEPNNPAMSDGVVVLQNGQFRGMQLCRADSDASDYGERSEAAMQRLPQSADLFTDETARADGE